VFAITRYARWQEPVAEKGRWWSTFNDATLTALIDRALAQNLTLRQAGLRVIQARALRGIAVGEFFPQSQTAMGQVSNNRVSKNSPLGFGDHRYNDYSLGLQAAWEPPTLAVPIRFIAVLSRRNFAGHLNGHKWR
jgi:outer membrane protein TolC